MLTKRLSQLLLLVTLLAAVALAFPHDPATAHWCSDRMCQEWVARYDGPVSDADWARALTVDGSGNVYVTGASESSGTGQDYATVKYTPAGRQQWVARYDGPASGADWAHALAVDGSGNVYVTGMSHGAATGRDYATVKYDSTGSEEWVARYDGPISAEDASSALALDDSGNVYVTGYSTGSASAYDCVTIKYAPDDSEEWVARYDATGGSDQGTAVAVDGSGNVYVTAKSDGSGTGLDYATIMYDSNGSEQWVARYDGPASSTDIVVALALDASGNVYVTGQSPGSGTGMDYATIMYDSNGGEEWVARYDGPISANEYARAVAVDRSGNVYVTGDSAGSGTGYDYATIKYDSAGNEEWVARYDGPAGGSDSPKAVALDGWPNVYVTGGSQALGTPARDYATIKYGPDGSEEWVARYDGPAGGEDRAKALDLDASGNVYVTGESAGSGTDYDYATIKYSRPPVGGLAEPPLLEPDATADASGSSASNTIALAAAAVGGALLMATGAWYARKRWLG